MSAYRSFEEAGWWKVADPSGDVVCRAWTQADAERIARALAVLDVMEERDTQITEAMQAMAEDEPAVPARGEAEP